MKRRTSCLPLLLSRLSPSAAVSFAFDTYLATLIEAHSLSAQANMNSRSVYGRLAGGQSAPVVAQVRPLHRLLRVYIAFVGVCHRHSISFQ